MVAKDISKNQIKVEIKDNNTGIYPPSFSMNLDTSKLEALGWKADVSLKEMYIRLIESLKK